MTKSRIQENGFFNVSISHFYNKFSTALHSYKSYLTLFLVTLFFPGINIHKKKEKTEGAPVQNLPLFTTAIGKLKLNCKSFGSNHLILEMPHDNVAHLAVLSPFQSIHSPSSIYHHMKVDKFHCCGQGHYCQWCTTLSCHMKLPFGVQEA